VQPSVETGTKPACDEVDALLSYMAVLALNKLDGGLGDSFIVQGLLGREPITVIFDSTAIGGDFVSQSLVNKCGLHLQERPQDVSLPVKGLSLESPGQLNAYLRFGAYKEVWPLTVLPLRNIDVILGTPWLKAHKATLDCDKMAVEFDAPQGHMMVQAGQNVIESFVVNVVTLSNLIAQDQVAQMYLVLLRFAEDEEAVAAPKAPPGSAAGQAPEIPFSKTASAHIRDSVLQARVEALLAEFEDRFQRPESLPTDHDGNVHRIPLKPGSKPPSRPTYRMSAIEREECKQQPLDLLRRAYIRPSILPKACYGRLSLGYMSP
jgi:hypothetical protein